MDIIETSLDGVFLVKLDCYRDERGFFLETYQLKKYSTIGIDDSFVQENHSRSYKGVLRGLHFQIKRPQSQIVTVMNGRIYYIVVDLRAESSTFGKHYGVELDDKEIRQIWVTEGFAHGYCVLSEQVDLHYKVSRFYDPSDEGGVLWNDPDLGINWPLERPIIKKRDAEYPRIKDLTIDKLPHTSPLD